MPLLYTSAFTGYLQLAQSMPSAALFALSVVYALLSLFSGHFFNALLIAVGSGQK